MGIKIKCGPCFLLASVMLSFSASPVRGQTPAVSLPGLDRARLDSLAALTAQKIRDRKHAEKEPKVVVIDFFRNSPGTSSQLGTVLADGFSESLASYSAGTEILDRKTLRNYLVENWTTLEDLRSNEICLGLAQQLGATGAILGTLNERVGAIELTLHLEGFGPKEEEDDVFPWRDRTVSFPMSEDLHTRLFKPGPNYSRKADEVPEEPGVFQAGINGVASPQCGYCPNADYPEAARTAKAEGKVVLSVVVTAEGQVGRIYVLKGRPSA